MNNQNTDPNGYTRPPMYDNQQQQYHNQQPYSQPPYPQQQPPKKKWGLIAAAAAMTLIIGSLAVGVGMTISSSKRNEPAANSSDYFITGCKDVMKVRETGENDGKVLTKLDNGEKVSLLEKSDGRYWKVYIEAEDITGYIDHHYLTNESDAVLEPSTEYVNVNANETLTILSTPDADGVSLGIANLGDEVTVLAKPNNKYSYVHVPGNSAFGYVESSKLSADKPQMVVKTDATTSAAANTTSPKAKVKNAPSATDLIGPGAPPVSHQGVFYANVDTGYLALRSAKAFDSSNEIGQISNGDIVYAIRSNEQYWYVYSPTLGSYGYTNSEYLTSTLPSADTSTYIPNVYYASVDSGYLALRSTQAFDPANEIGKIANGQEVHLVDTASGSYWYVYVPALDAYGYVNSEYLR